MAGFEGKREGNVKMALKFSAFTAKQWPQTGEMGMSKMCFCLKIFNVCVPERSNSRHRIRNWIRWSRFHRSLKQIYIYIWESSAYGLLLLIFPRKEYLRRREDKLRQNLRKRKNKTQHLKIQENLLKKLINAERGHVQTQEKMRRMWFHGSQGTKYFQE